MKTMKHYLILALTACFFATQIVSNGDDDLTKINEKTRVKIFKELSEHGDYCLAGTTAIFLGIFLGATIPQAIQNSQDYTRSIQLERACLQQKTQPTSPCNCSCPQQICQPESSPYFSNTIAQAITQKPAAPKKSINYYDLARTCPTHQNSSPNIAWFAVSDEN